MKKNIEIVPVRTIEEVLAHALVEMPGPQNSDSDEEIKHISPEPAENKGEDVIRH